MPTMKYMYAEDMKEHQPSSLSSYYCSGEKGRTNICLFKINENFLGKHQAIFPFLSINVLNTDLAKQKIVFIISFKCI